MRTFFNSFSTPSFTILISWSFNFLNWCFQFLEISLKYSFNSFVIISKMYLSDVSFVKLVISLCEYGLNYSPALVFSLWIQVFFDNFPLRIGFCCCCCCKICWHALTLFILVITLPPKEKFRVLLNFHVRARHNWREKVLMQCHSYVFNLADYYHVPEI